MVTFHFWSYIFIMSAKLIRKKILDVGDIVLVVVTPVPWTKFKGKWNELLWNRGYAVDQQNEVGIKFWRMIIPGFNPTENFLKAEVC